MKGICQVCSGADSKYKCPKCLIQYCSLNCFRNHKGACEESLSTETSRQNLKVEEEKHDIEEGEIDDDDDMDNNNFDIEDKVPQHLLEMLGNSTELKNQLKNKHLRNMLLEIDNDTDPGERMDKAMQIVIFTEFVETCMGIVKQNHDKDKET